MRHRRLIADQQAPEEPPMNRSSLLKGAAAGAVVPVLPPGLRAAAATAGTIARRVRASDTAWPGEADWEKLNQALGGNLIKVQSPLAACGQAADETACRQVLEALRNPYYIGDEVGLTQSAGWVDAWISAPSVYAVAARGTADVVAAVNFRAREQSAACRQRRRAQLSGHVQCRGFAADLDAGGAQHRLARCVRRARVRYDPGPAAGSHGRGGRDVDRCLRRGDDKGRPLCSGWRLRHRRCRRAHPKRRIRELLEEFRHGRGGSVGGRNRYGRRC